MNPIATNTVTPDLAGRHALVAGGSEGIGRATTFALAERGASVTVLARSEDKLRALAAALPTPAPGQQHGWIAVDVSDTDMLRAKLEAVVSAHPVQILVNNSGGPPGGALADAPVDALLAVFRQHLIAGHVMLQAVLPGMRTACFGRLINVISTSVKEPIPGLGVSNTIRGAVASWAKTLATELGPHGITVNNVLPGFTETGRLSGLITAKAQQGSTDEEAIARSMLASVPAGRFAKPEETAAAIAFLASPSAGYINGVNLPVDGGRTKSL
jgi:3-oxoacyl-[acyl-carrier protein] reductase